MNFINPLFYTRMFSVGAVIVAFLVCFFCHARAQLALPAGETHGELSVSEQRFLRQVVTESAHQMHLAKLATQRAKTPAVRQYAGQALATSTRLHQDASALLTNNHLQEARVASSGAEARECRELTAAHDEEFDAAFLRVIARKQKLITHQLNIAAQEREAGGVRPLVTNYLATFHHLTAQAAEVTTAESPTLLVAGS